MNGLILTLQLVVLWWREGGEHVQGGLQLSIPRSARPPLCQVTGLVLTSSSCLLSPRPQADYTASLAA